MLFKFVFITLLFINSVQASFFEDLVNHIEENGIEQDDGLSEGLAVDPESLPALEAGQAVEDMFGMELDGADIVEQIRQNDPNGHLLPIGEEVFDGDPNDFYDNKNDLKPQPEFVKDHEELSSPCLIELLEGPNIPQDILLEHFATLEKRLVAEATPLAEQQLIFCTLMFHYERLEMFDRLIEFLLLNAPEGENLCAS